MNKILLFLAAFSFNTCFALSLSERNEVLFKKIKQVHKLSDKQINTIKKIFSNSGYIGQGNPSITKHPMTEKQCKNKNINYDNPNYQKICGGKYMSPLYDPKTQKPEQAKTCIDQFEYPDIPCTYPVVWVKAKEAAEICNAMGKRLCDAHEWEGACEGKLLAPDYDFSLIKKMTPKQAIHKMRATHNAKAKKNKLWSYGPSYKTGICATSSFKSKGCNGGDWKKCGSNTFPSGAFPKCKSSLGVYDINGNAAEHMNLPLSKSQMASNDPNKLGYTEMKGSWFIFDTYKAHPDYCRWRAPFWHGTKVMSNHSHHNYHLGFRCCKNIKK